LLACAVRLHVLGWDTGPTRLLATRIHSGIQNFPGAVDVVPRIQGAFLAFKVRRRRVARDGRLDCSFISFIGSSKGRLPLSTEPCYEVAIRFGSGSDLHHGMQNQFALLRHPQLLKGKRVGRKTGIVSRLAFDGRGGAARPPRPDSLRTRPSAPRPLSY